MTDATAHTICSECNNSVPGGHRFCNHCGAPIVDDFEKPVHDTQALYYSTLQERGRAKLVLLKGESPEGSSYHLAGSEHIVGRQQGDISFEDPFVSPQHAAFFYYDGQLYVRDEDSLNGIFLKCRGDTPLEDGTMILAGSHVFLFERLTLDPMPTAPDGTRVHISPSPGPLTFRLVEILVDGHQGQAHASPYSEISVGRQGCDLSFPDDVHMSHHHFKVTDDGVEATLVDLGSRNGTYIRLRNAEPLEHGDLLFLGRQFLRVETVN